MECSGDYFEGNGRSIAVADHQLGQKVPELPQKHSRPLVFDLWRDGRVQHMFFVPLLLAQVGNLEANAACLE